MRQATNNLHLHTVTMWQFIGRLKCGINTQTAIYHITTLKAQLELLYSWTVMYLKGQEARENFNNTYTNIVTYMRSYMITVIIQKWNNSKFRE